MKKMDSYKLLIGFMVFSVGMIIGISFQQIMHKCPHILPCPNFEDECKDELEKQQEFYESVFGVAKDEAERCNNALGETMEYEKNLFKALRRCEEGQNAVNLQPLRTRNEPIR